MTFSSSRRVTRTSRNQTGSLPNPDRFAQDFSRKVLIVGASTRAAAYSAVRAGFQPVCADRYADEDLKAVAEILPLSDYPDGLVNSVRMTKPCPWMYTGAIENHPEIVARIATDRPLAGNPARVLRQVRDPFRIAQILQNNGLPALSVRDDSDPPHAAGEWLLKPLRSGGGTGIRVWNDATAREQPSGKAHYFQRRADGTSWSALFLASSQRTWLIGIARQLVGHPASYAEPFAYCGSIAPLPRPHTRSVLSSLQQIGTALARGCALRGLFGCDLIYDGQTIWLTEVNPRYTASVETFEHAYALPLLSWHWHATMATKDSQETALFERSIASKIDTVLTSKPPRFVGKQILFAAHDIKMPSLEGFVRRNAVDSVRLIADIPRENTVILRKQPICTLLACGQTFESCRAELEQRVAEISVFLFSKCSDRLRDS